MTLGPSHRRHQTMDKNTAYSLLTVAGIALPLVIITVRALVDAIQGYMGGN